jgi:hypothetical protein
MSQNQNLTPDADVQNGCVFQETSDEKVFTSNSTGLLSCFNLTCLRMLHVLGVAKAGALRKDREFISFNGRNRADKN